MNVKPAIRKLAEYATSLGIEAIHLDDYKIVSVLLPSHPLPIIMDNLAWMDSSLKRTPLRNMCDKRIKNAIIHLQMSGRYVGCSYYCYLTVDNWLRLFKIELCIRAIRRQYESLLLEYAKADVSIERCRCKCEHDHASSRSKQLRLRIESNF